MNAMTSLARRYASDHPQSAERRFRELPTRDVADFLSALDPEVAAALVQRMWPATGASVLAGLVDERAGEVLERLELSTTVLILRQCPEDDRTRIVESLPPTLAERVQQALAVQPGTVGSVVDSSVAVAVADASVRDARQQGLDPRLPYLYVVDGEHRLVGVIHRRDLERADDRVQLQSLMRDPVQTLPAEASLAGIANHDAWSAFDVLPVVGARGAFHGVVRHKSLRSLSRHSAAARGSQSAVTALLDLGEVYWSGLFSAIEFLASSATVESRGGNR